MRALARTGVGVEGEMGLISSASPELCGKGGQEVVQITQDSGASGGASVGA